MQTTCKTLSVNIMGKSTMGLGQYSGRIGGLVFAKGDNGTQIIRTYQPTVKNPRSDAQQTQRAKLNLAGRISAAMPTNLLYSLGNNGRERRGNFVANLIKSMTVQRSGGNNEAFEAQLNPASVVISKGDYLPINPNLVVQSGTIQVSWQDITGQYGITASATVTAVLMFMHQEGEFPPVVVTETTDLATRSINVTAPTQLSTPETYVHVYLVVNDVPTVANSTITSGAQSGASQILASLTNGEGLSNLSWFQTLYAGSSVVGA